MSLLIRVGEGEREACPKLGSQQHDLDLDVNVFPRRCRACNVKVCPHCWGGYTNFNKHLQGCREYKRSVYQSRHRGHRAFARGPDGRILLDDTDMRVSGRTRKG